MWDILKDILVWVFESFYSAIMSALIAILEFMPVPSFISDLGTAAGNIPPSVGYWLGIFQVPFGLSVILLSLSLRFILRRIPFIG